MVLLKGSLSWVCPIHSQHRKVAQQTFPGHSDPPSTFPLPWNSGLPPLQLGPPALLTHVESP